MHPSRNTHPASNGERLDPVYAAALEAHQPLKHSEFVAICERVIHRKRIIWRELLSCKPIAKYLINTIVERLTPPVTKQKSPAEQAHASRHTTLVGLRDTYIDLSQKTSAKGQAEFLATMEQAADTLAWLDSSCETATAIIDDIEDGLAKRTIGTKASRAKVDAMQTTSRTKVAVRSWRREREPLITHNLRLVVSVARKLPSRDMGLQERVSYGNYGLIKAVNRFDHRKGFQFSTFATYWIRHAVNRNIQVYGALVRVPCYMHDSRRTLMRLKHERPGESLEALAEEAGVNPKHLKTVRAMSYVPRGLLHERDEQYSTGDRRNPVGGHVELVSPDSSDAAIESRELFAAVQDVLYEKCKQCAGTGERHGVICRRCKGCGDFLSERERHVIVKRFDLDGSGEHTLQSIAAEFKVSREWVRKVQIGALAKIRERLGVE